MSHIQFYMFQIYFLYIVFIKEENKYTSDAFSLYLDI